MVGMLAANIVARNRALLDRQVEKEIAKELLCQTWWYNQTNCVEADSMIEAMKKDKKTDG